MNNEEVSDIQMIQVLLDNLYKKALDDWEKNINQIKSKHIIEYQKNNGREELEKLLTMYNEREKQSKIVERVR